MRVINSLKIEDTLLRKSPLPLFAKEGLYSSLWKREVGRDFIKQCCYYFKTVNNLTGLLKTFFAVLCALCGEYPFVSGQAGSWRPVTL